MAEWSDTCTKGLASTPPATKALIGLVMLLLLTVACGDSQEASKPTQQSSNKTAGFPSGQEKQLPRTSGQLVQVSTACPEWGTPALFKADVLQRCIAEGLNPNAKISGIPLLAEVLNVAGRSGHDAVEAVQVLLEAGANVNARNERGLSTLMLASGWGHTATVQALLDAGADVSAPFGKDKYTVLMLASGLGHTATVQVLLQAGADVNAQDGGGKTALMIATEEGRTATVQALLQAGADVNAQDGGGGTALIIAAANGRTAIAQALLDAGTDLDLQTSGGSTAYSIAKNGGHTEIMNMIEKIDAFR